MNTRKIAYWTSLVLFSLAMGLGGVADLMKSPEIIESMKKLGYPEYLALILGVWKIGGVLAILLPGFSFLKEWAYAGFLFNLTGASISHAMVQDDIVKVVVPLVILAIGGCSWVLRPASLHRVVSVKMRTFENRLSFQG